MRKFSKFYVHLNIGIFKNHVKLKTINLTGVLLVDCIHGDILLLIWVREGRWFLIGVTCASLHSSRKSLFGDCAEAGDLWVCYSHLFECFWMMTGFLLELRSQRYVDCVFSYLDGFGWSLGFYQSVWLFNTVGGFASFCPNQAWKNVSRYVSHVKHLER